MPDPHYFSNECKAKRHTDCDGYVPRGYDEAHDHECECICHEPNYLKE